MGEKQKMSLAPAASQDSSFKRYIKYFLWAFIVLGVLAVVFAVVMIGRAARKLPERTNTECLTEERVFDQADVLTDKEEEKLRELIAKRERQTGCDIVLVTLNESLKDYARQEDPAADYSEFVRIYADNFFDTNLFGYDKPKGDAVLLLDNWYREENGSVYTWLCTTGKALDRYSSGMIDRLLDKVYEKVEADPYKAYKAYINQFYADMTGKSYPRGVGFSVGVPLGVGFGAALIFILIHLPSRRGKKTVTSSTYVSGGRPQMRAQEDRFIRTVVTKRKIERNNSSSGGSGGSGGGGYHVSSSGTAHGGGGHSR